MNQNICYITKKTFPDEALYKGSTIKSEIMKLIVADFPGFNSDSFISIDALNKYRRKYLATVFSDESGELDTLEKEVLDSITKNSILSENIETDISEHLTLGQRMADNIAKFGGSWIFIITFFSFILVWICTNVWILVSKPFDPYPYILLNLILSCIASIQAPIIMMSQNRQEDKDRKRSENDFKVNLKAELEIRLLNEKIDHFIIHQNKHLFDIQQLQADYLDDIMEHLHHLDKNNQK
jgi:uncharacterized membrane protein